MSWSIVSFVSPDSAPVSVESGFAVLAAGDSAAGAVSAAITSGVMIIASVGASKETAATDSGAVTALVADTTPISSATLVCCSAAVVAALTGSSEVSGISAGASGARATAVAAP